MNKRIVASCAAAVAACAASAKASDAPWVYLPTESVISNDNAVGKSTGYVLKVKVRDAAKHALAVGNGGGAGDAYVKFGGDTLDLSERIEGAALFSDVFRL